MQNANDINVGINAQGAKKGADDVTSALKSIERSLKSVQKVLEDVNKTASGGGGGGGGGGGPTGDLGKKIPEADTALQAFMGTLNKIRNTLFVIYLLREAFDGVTAAIRALIATGIEFNAAMEQAVIGSGALIAQIGQLERSNVKLEGVEAIREGMKLAKEEVLQLQIAGLQTAATSQALVKAFQQAVGPGLAAGLALKQVRDLTVDIVQVATAIGQPMHQIAQEVRAIFEGTVDPNARVGKLLDIDNEVVKKLQGTAKLYDYIAQKLDKFRAVGPIIEKSWSGVTSNLQEFGEVLSGLVTKPLFEKMTESLVKFNDELRKGGAGKGADTLQSLFAPDIQAGVENLQKAFLELGIQADRVLISLADRARDALAVFDEDPTQIKTLEEAIRRVGDSLVRFINEADVRQAVKDMVQVFGALSRIIRDSLAFWDGLITVLRTLKGLLELILSPVLLIGRGLEAIVNFKFDGDNFKRFWQNVTNDVNKSVDDIQKAWKSSGNVVETSTQRMNKALNSTKGVMETLSEEVDGLEKKFARDPMGKALPAIKSVPKGASQEDRVKYLQGLLSLKDLQEKIKINAPPPPPKTDKNAASKAAREAERLAAKERAFQLAKLQFIEQTARDEIGLRDAMNKILLKQNEERYDREMISLNEFENEKKRILIAGAMDEKAIALLRVKGAALAGAKALSQITILAPFEDVAGADAKGIEAYKKQLAGLIDVVKTQEQAEAARELVQALTGLEDALLRLKVAQGGFELDKLPVIKRREPIDLPLPQAAADIAVSANLRKEREKILALATEEAEIQKAVTLGYITQAEAAERLTDHAERLNQFEIERLKSERDRLDVVTQAEERLQKDLELAERMNKVFRVSNSDAFFKGLNENIDKLSDKFRQLGEDIRSIFRDAFEELGRTGFRGFVDTFLQGIADALNTRAADALSQIVTKILTDIFKPGGSGQSIFDKLIEQLLSIFGRKPTGTLSIGGIFEKIFGKLLDPLGRSKPAAGPFPGAPQGLPAPHPDSIRVANADERIEAVLRGTQPEIVGIHREVMDIAQSLRELKQCCREHNDLLKQQMSAASKGPGLLGQILSAAAGAAAGGFIGGINFGGGGGGLTAGAGVGDELPILPSPWAPGEPFPGGDLIPPGFFPAPPGGQLRYNDPNKNLAVNTNITIVTPNPAAFNAPQTQAQIGSLVFGSIQKAQSLVPAITNPNAVNK